jgi:hypothetical protein
MRFDVVSYNSKQMFGLKSAKSLPNPAEVLTARWA